MLSMVIIGGLGSIPGALLGATFLFGVPALLGTSDVVRHAVSGFGLLIFLLFFPKGLVGIANGARDAFASRARRRADGLPAPPRLIPPLSHLYAVARGLPIPEGR
jgi:branched-chain amino acid transport system permease protein